ncbi:Uncharacterized protein FWK35_00026641 [Aphis craccivora]|uniref:SWIM-type domain-containing protein n=1 Tax=Aphis craccivora TaxID=307492 RepID=A0A6G0Y4W5_APHCR|nr:Uncharacterized protein FWK35_00026641 [Aphis craccivora]
MKICKCIAFNNSKYAPFFTLVWKPITGICHRGRSRQRPLFVLPAIHNRKLTYKIKELRKRHKNSLEMSSNNVLKDGEDCWNVMASDHDDMYTVNKLNDSCGRQIVCDECKTCIYCFSCTCIDSAIQLNFCKHIHLVCISDKAQYKNTNSYSKNLS